MSGFRCPKCGGVTRVIETRPIPGGLRRRRLCDTLGCEGKITTAELVVSQTWQPGPRTRGPVVAVRLRDLHTIERIIVAGLAGVELKEIP